MQLRRNITLCGLFGSSEVRSARQNRAAVCVAHTRIGKQDAGSQCVRAIQSKQIAATVLMRIGDGPVAHQRIQQTAGIAQKTLASSERKLDSC